MTSIKECISESIGTNVRLNNVWASSKYPTEKQLDSMFWAGDVTYLGEIFQEFQEDINNGDNSEKMCVHLISALQTYFGDVPFRIVYPEVKKEHIKLFSGVRFSKFA